MGKGAYAKRGVVASVHVRTTGEGTNSGHCVRTNSMTPFDVNYLLNGRYIKLLCLCHVTWIERRSGCCFS